LLVVTGALIAATPTIGEWMGQWSQHRDAIEVDATRTRYLWAAEAGYAAQSTVFEDSLVSFEIGALPRNSAGIEIPPARPVVDARPTVHNAIASPEAVVSISGADETVPEPTGPPLAIRIPTIGVDQAVVDGVGRADLRNGPGHYPGTALPGQHGNMVISGHRTTYTKPFYDIDALAPGDSVFVDTASGSFEYLVTESWVVDPSDVTPLESTAEATLTMTTCTPRGSASQRLIVRAVLVGGGGSIAGV
jgi:sortase A